MSESRPYESRPSARPTQGYAKADEATQEPRGLEAYLDKHLVKAATHHEVDAAIAACTAISDEFRALLQEVGKRLDESVPTNVELVTRHAVAGTRKKGLFNPSYHIDIEVTEEAHGTGWRLPGPGLSIDKNGELWAGYSIDFHRSPDRQSDPGVKEDEVHGFTRVGVEGLFSSLITKLASGQKINGSIEWKFPIDAVRFSSTWAGITAPWGIPISPTFSTCQTVLRLKLARADAPDAYEARYYVAGDFRAQICYNRSDWEMPDSDLLTSVYKDVLEEYLGPTSKR